MAQGHVRKLGPNLFEWTIGGIKGTIRNPPCFKRLKATVRLFLLKDEA